MGSIIWTTLVWAVRLSCVSACVYVRTPDGKIVTVDPSGSVFTWSSGMNNLGAITGYYLDANNVYHGFLRTQDW